MKRKSWFSKLPTPVKVVGGILALIAAYQLYRNMRKIPQGFAKALQTDQQIKVIRSTAYQYGIDPARAEALQTIAADIYAAFWETAFGMMEDEEKATNAMNRCRSVNEAKYVAIIYRQLYNKDLWSNFDEYCNFFDPIPRTELLNAIKGL